MAPSLPNSIDLRFLEHPTMGIVALKADMACEDVEAFITWIRQVLTLIAEQNAWQNLPSTLAASTPLASALIESCNSRKRQLDDGGPSSYEPGSYGGYGGGGGGGYGGGGGGYSRAKRPNTGPPKCFVCGTPGHRSNQCPQNAGSGYGRESGASRTTGTDSYEPGGYGSALRKSTGPDNDRNYGSYGTGSYATGANTSPIQNDRGPTASVTQGDGSQTVIAPSPSRTSMSHQPATNDPTSPQNPRPSSAAAGEKLHIENDDWVPRVDAIKKECINFYDLSSSGED